MSPMNARTQTFLALGVGAIGLLLAVMLGSFAYMAATATPLHPDPQDVPSVTRAAASLKWADAVTQARQIVRAAVAEQNLPGLSVAVGVGGDIVWDEGFGWANLESQTPVTPDTRFRIGEASKALTSAAVGLLLEKNLLRLDEEIQTYVPDFPKKQWPVTLRQLMAHVAGLRDDPGDEAWLEPCERTFDGLKLFADDSLLFEPGTRYRASSYSWILVSAAIEAAAPGQTFFTFMRTQVFEPLRMSSTRPDSAREQIPDRATFYFPKFAGDTRYGPQSTREGDHTCYAGASAFLSTAADMVRFGTAVTGGKLLQPATVQLLQTEQQLKSGETTGYGLGWRVETVSLAGAPTRVMGHGAKGDFIGGSPYLLTCPERGLVVAVLSNISFADAKSVALKVAETFAAAPARPLYHR
jgi:serine beta-lactamase-like protein LACTB, mitochondrial